MSPHRELRGVMSQVNLSTTRSKNLSIFYLTPTSLIFWRYQTVTWRTRQHCDRIGLQRSFAGLPFLEYDKLNYFLHKLWVPGFSQLRLFFFVFIEFGYESYYSIWQPDFLTFMLSSYFQGIQLLRPSCNSRNSVKFQTVKRLRCIT